MTGTLTSNPDLQIVVLDGHTLNPGDLNWSPFEHYGNVTVYPQTTENDLIKRSMEADVIVVNKVVINRSSLKQLSRLKAICVTATGMNNVDLDAAADRGIPVFNVRGYGTESVAQHVFALILYFTNQVAMHAKAVSGNEWSKQSHFSMGLSPLTELSGKVLGIYGFGNIGKAVARIGHAYGMRIIVCTRYPGEYAYVDAFVSLSELFQKSDFITLHSQLTEENNGIVNLSLLRTMKFNAVLINTGRGALINENDLVTALQEKTLAGAGLDVMNQEPPPADHPFFKMEDIIVTPHIAWSTKEARQRLMQMSADQLQNLWRGNND